MKNPRISITLNANDLELMQVLCEQRKMALSSLAKKIIADWLEDEKKLMSKSAREAEKRTEEKPTTVQDKVCRKFNIESY